MALYALVSVMDESNKPVSDEIFQECINLAMKAIGRKGDIIDGSKVVDTSADTHPINWNNDNRNLREECLNDHNDGHEYVYVPHWHLNVSAEVEG